MSSELLNTLRTGKILVCDGAMGTQLHLRGLQAGQCPEELNLTRPDIVQAVHVAYFEAGADIVETNTFGGNGARLQRHGRERNVREYCRKAAELAREVCPPGKYVAGSVGPTGEMLEPLGPLTESRAFSLFSQQTGALAEGGVDFIVVETMMSLEEAAAAVRAAREQTALPVACTMTYEKGAGGFRTMWGVSVEQAVRALTDEGVAILGANCSRGFADLASVAEVTSGKTDLPIMIQPNAGMPELVGGQPVYPEKPEQIVQHVVRMLETGVRIVGGCCGTTPDHIRAIRQAVDRFGQAPERSGPG